MAVNTLTMGPGTLTIGSQTNLTQFASQVTECVLKPKVDNDDPIPVLSGEEAPGDRSESWTLEGSLLQDLGAAGSVVEWLFTHRGELHPFTFVPRSGAGAKQIIGTLQVEAVDIGGAARTKPSSDFEFVVIGAPTISTVP